MLTIIITLKALSSQKVQHVYYNTEKARLMRLQFPFVDLNFVPLVTDRRGIVAKQEEREKLLEMMDSHSKKHPLIPNDVQACMLPSAIHQGCAQEVYLFCLHHGLPDAWAYLSCEWYCIERWTLWSRSTVPGMIPGASTTMMVEAHWSLIKRHHLINSPRARLDRVIQILMEETVPQLLQKWYQALVLRRYLLPFEKIFSKVGTNSRPLVILISRRILWTLTLGSAAAQHL